MPVLPAKQRRLLAAFVIHAGRRLSVDSLLEAVWDGSAPASARKVLQIYVSQLRRTLPPEIAIRTDEGGYTLEFDLALLDATRFERLLTDGRSALADGNPALAHSLLRRALALWRGDAYGELGFEEFARGEADRLDELRLLAVEELMEAGLRLGRHEQLLPELRQLATAQPLRERAHEHLMLALYLCGRQTEALETFTELQSRLRDQLGLEPGRPLRELQRRILEHDPALAASTAPYEARVSLPIPPSPLVGRERELEELRRLVIDERVRLVVLTGAGGSGKTRLALDVARNNAGAFANGAALVELAALRDPDLVLGAIAAAVGVRDRPGDPFDSIAEALRSRELLLVLDNAEHLRDAAPLYVQLLAVAPRLKLLVTSRTVLHLSGERVYPVEPLGEEAAIVLFRERAHAVDRRVQLTSADTPAIERICERLDRLPLAIELAATRVRVFTPVELLARLDVRLPLLTGGPNDLPARQQTLRATLEWSHDLLHERAQREFAALAVFSGGFTLEAAEAVVDGTADGLGTLVEHNLVQRRSDSNTSRYGTLETIREYALERLEESGRADKLRLRHAQHYADVFEATAPAAMSPTLMTLFTCELDNVRLAFDTAVASRAGPVALRLAVSTARYWIVRGAADEGARRVRGAIAIADEGRPLLRARALEVAAELERHRGDIAAAIGLATESRRAARTAASPQLEGEALIALGRALVEAGEVDAAARSLEEALAISGDYDLPRATSYLAYIDLLRRDFLSAVNRFEEVLELLGETNAWARAANLENLALAHLHLGRLDTARHLLDEAEEINGALGANASLTRNLLARSAVALADGRFELAARLGGAAEAASRSVGTPFDGFQRGLKQRTERRLVAVLGRERSTQLWEEGTALDLGQAIALREVAADLIVQAP